MVLHKLTTYGRLVMFSHTIFSLPFALISMFLAAQGFPEGRVFFWALVALVAGRNGANALNRWVDRDMDKKNPRTAHREVPQGKVSPKEVLLITAFCYTIFIIAAGMINTLTLLLSPVALILFTLYSYTKRFTWLCHGVLGFTCGGAAVGGWIAVTGSFAITPFILGAVIMFWVGGFDIIYGTQDIDFDRINRVFSIPSKFGLRGALWIARGCHLIMMVLLISLFWFQDILGWGYGISILLGGVLLLVEHWVVDPANRDTMNLASYHINQIISPLIFLGVVVDIFLL